MKSVCEDSKIVLLSVTMVIFTMIAAPLSAQRKKYSDYPSGYPFGSKGTATHTTGYDGFPGDTPAGTPGAPAGTPPNGGPGGDGFDDNSNGGPGGDGKDEDVFTAGGNAVKAELGRRVAVAEMVVMDIQAALEEREANRRPRAQPEPAEATAEPATMVRTVATAEKAEKRDRARSRVLNLAREDWVGLVEMVVAPGRLAEKEVKVAEVVFQLLAKPAERGGQEVRAAEPVTEVLRLGKEGTAA